MFFKGLNTPDQKKREMTVTQVKKQCEDMLFEEEMEQIILSKILATGEGGRRPSDFGEGVQ